MADTPLTIDLDIKARDKMRSLEAERDAARTWARWLRQNGSLAASDALLREEKADGWAKEEED